MAPLPFALFMFMGALVVADAVAVGLPKATDDLATMTVDPSHKSPSSAVRAVDRKQVIVSANAEVRQKFSVIRASERASLSGSAVDLEKTIAARKDDNKMTCPHPVEEDADYKYVKATLEILNSVNRTYFNTGGSAMAMMRFGANVIHPHIGQDRRFAFDNDIDIWMLFESDADQHAICKQIETRCKEAKIFERCEGCGFAWSKEGTDWVVHGKEVANPDVMISNLRDQNDGTFCVSWSKHWCIDSKVLFPLQKAKYYDLEFPAVQRPLEFFSQARAPYATQPSPEYGAGCWGHGAMAYPDWMTGVAKWGTTGEAGYVKEKPVVGLSISEDVLEQCAMALKSEGFASFSECFPRHENP